MVRDLKKSQPQTPPSPLCLTAVEEKSKNVIEKAPASLLSNHRGISLFDLV